MFLEVRKSVSIVIFACICLIVIGIGFSGNLETSFSVGRGKEANSARKRENSQSKFNNIEYFKLENGMPSILLNGEIMLMEGDGGSKTSVTGISGRAYTNDQQEIYYTAKEGRWDSDRQMVWLNQEVKMRTDDSEVVSDRATYNMIQGELNYIDNVKTKSIDRKSGDRIFVNSQTARSWPSKKKSRFVGKVDGRIERKRVYEETIYFGSSELELDLNKHIITLERDVSLKKQAFNAEAINGEIHLKNYNKKLKYYVLSDDVKVWEKVKQSGRIVLRRAFAERLEGIVSEDKIILTGSPKVFQDGDVIKGNKIILRSNSEVVEVDDAITNFNLK